MPQFHSEHVQNNLDAFTTGYLECAEWLAQNRQKERADFSLTAEERTKCRGFTKAAIQEARRVCREFQRENKADLAAYLEKYAAASAGMDLWLSRNGHGAGFFDRGYEPHFKALQEAAKSLGGRECSLYRNRLVFE